MEPLILEYTDLACLSGIILLDKLFPNMGGFRWEYGDEENSYIKFYTRDVISKGMAFDIFGQIEENLFIMKNPTFQLTLAKPRLIIWKEKEQLVSFYPNEFLRD